MDLCMISVGSDMHDAWTGNSHNRGDDLVIDMILDVETFADKLHFDASAQ